MGLIKELPETPATFVRTEKNCQEISSIICILPGPALVCFPSDPCQRASVSPAPVRGLPGLGILFPAPIIMYQVRGNTLYSVSSLSIYVMMSQRIVNETQSACVCTGSLTNGPLSCPLCWWHHHQHHSGYCHHHQRPGGLYHDFTLRRLLVNFETTLGQFWYNVGTTLGTNLGPHVQYLKGNFVSKFPGP